ncbi:MAG: response regulator [Thermodesulfobacteriota bacterium]
MSRNTVLIADDDPGVRDLFKELLHGEGYRLFFASNGREAVEIALHQPIDVAILDLRMPVMSGIEALREIKKIDETVQVLMITGFADMDSLSECASEGALDYIPKPVHLQEITRSVRRAVLRRQIRNGLLQNRIKRG